MQKNIWLAAADGDLVRVQASLLVVVHSPR